MADVISMSFPADTEYISAIRLAISGVAGMQGYNVEEIEDLKSCVSEACLLLMGGQITEGICLTILVKDNSGEIAVKVFGEGIRADHSEGYEGFNEEMSKLMIQALSENADFNEEKGLLQSITFSKKHQL